MRLATFPADAISDFQATATSNKIRTHAIRLIIGSRVPLQKYTKGNFADDTLELANLSM